jgi:hypothetical protein
MKYEGLKYIFDNYPDLDKVLVCPDGEIFLPQNLHIAKDYCTSKKLQWSGIREYTRTALHQDYQPEPEKIPVDPNIQKPSTEPTTEKPAKK